MHLFFSISISLPHVDSIKQVKFKYLLYCCTVYTVHTKYCMKVTLTLNTTLLGNWM